MAWFREKPPPALPFKDPGEAPATPVPLPSPLAAPAKLLRIMLPLGRGAIVVPGGGDGGGGAGGFTGAQTTCCSRGASTMFSVGPRGNVLAVCTSYT